MRAGAAAKLKGIRAEHVHAAIEEVKRDGFPPEHASKTYHLMHEGTAYPQKYIASLATRHASGTQLLPAQFSAGQSRPILEALGFTIRAAQARAGAPIERMAIEGELIGELYYYAREVHENRLSPDEATAALGIAVPTAAAYFRDFRMMREGEVYQRTMNAAATEYFLQHIHQDYGIDGLRLALQAVDRHLRYYDTVGKGTQRQIRALWEKYSAVAGNGPHHAIEGSYAGPSPSFRASPTKTSIDLSLANTLPDEPLSERDTAFLSDIWKTYGMAEFARRNMDAGSIRRALQRGVMEYVSGDAATPQCIFRLTAKARALFEAEESLFLNEAGAQTAHVEGGLSEAMRAYYKRNPKARGACLAHYGYRCVVCAFDFEATYGAIGRQFIHVHHENEMALAGSEQYVIDPVKDLKPVCPNCHAMLHQKTPAYSIEELREMLDA